MAAPTVGSEMLPRYAILIAKTPVFGVRPSSGTTYAIWSELPGRPESKFPGPGQWPRNRPRRLILHLKSANIPPRAAEPLDTSSPAVLKRTAAAWIPKSLPVVEKRVQP